MEQTTRMSQPIYTLRDVSKMYDGDNVLHIDALDIYPGEILALVGPSGAGKSTLLRLLNFLEFTDTGSLTYRGHPIAPPRVPLSLRREVTMVFQRPALLSASVERNVSYGLRVRGNRDGHAVIRGALERLGMDGMRHARARTLSGGEAQRVALARATILNPTVLLLDEPTANLDPYNVSIIEEVVREMNEERSTTVVLVTHNVFQARRLANRVALLLRGRLVEVADRETFFNDPASPRTAAFINGEMVY